MTLEKILIALLGSCALVACAPAAKDASEAPPTSEAPSTPSENVAAEPDAAPADELAVEEPAADDHCAAVEYQSLIGSNAAAVTLPADLVHRIYKQGDPVTLDYRPDRLNIVTDENGVVIEVKCG